MKPEKYVVSLSGGKDSTAMLLRLLEEKQVEAYYFPSFAEIEDFLREKCMNGDLLITMGAGNVVNIGEDLLK